MYLDPTTKPNEKDKRDEQGRRLWIRETWDWILAGLDGQSPPMPTWAQRYALSQFSVSSPALAKWFEGYNTQRPHDEHIRPGSFGLIAHPDPAFYTHSADTDAQRIPSGLPAAPFERKPERWPNLQWYDRATGKPLNVITGQARDELERFAQTLSSGAVVIDALTNILGRYTRRPEHKSLAPNGQPTDTTTHGQLLRRAIRRGPTTTQLTGKEGNKLIERLTGQITATDEYRNDYGTRRDPWDALVLPVLKDMGAARITDSGIPTTTVYRTLTEERKPRPANRERLQAAAVAFATENLAGSKASVPLPAYDVLETYLHQRGNRPENVRRCFWCGEPMPTTARADAKYHNDACRQAAKRAG